MVTTRSNEPEDGKNGSEFKEVISDEVYIQDMEYAELNDALDEIGNCLDDLERRNEALHRELSNLLESNRKMRQEFQNSSA